MTTDEPLRPKARAPRGFQDRRAAALTAERNILDAVSAVYESYGFERLDTGAFEYADALGKFLPDADRPNDGVFALQGNDFPTAAEGRNYVDTLSIPPKSNWTAMAPAGLGKRSPRADCPAGSHDAEDRERRGGRSGPRKTHNGTKLEVIGYRVDGFRPACARPRFVDVHAHRARRSSIERQLAACSRSAAARVSSSGAFDLVIPSALAFARITRALIS